MNKSISLSGDRFLQICLHQKKTWWLYLHDSSYAVSASDWNGFEIGRGFYYSLTFSYQSFHLLKSPFATNCKNYRTDSEYHSRKECIRNCKLKHSIQNCGFISHGVEVYRGESNKWFASTSEEVKCVQDLDLGKIC